ncbi:eukaryotic translation initiation factor 2B subunit alpha L homeolog [Xenopus laevis]|uniref:Translation initiation factor eIF2B subunit alpha n=1 Tax=Xenopus laevis TaxID=8355 RepID=Q6NUG3_XENLA|nr:eukaryotic translation initiation factor 2B subunit alpha L homeolog [Xenopus laevis]AAH68625.1 MGC78997 protein [Xenopus laevis]
MNEEEILQYFKCQLQEDTNVATAVAAIRTLLEFLKRDTGETIQGLIGSLKDAIGILSKVDSSVSVSSGGELFLRFITLTSELEHSNYDKCKKMMSERGELFLKRISMSRNKITTLCCPFIKDGAKILTHAYSKVVLKVLEEAAASKNFSVYITESQPDLSGKIMADALRKRNVPVTLILDAAVGYIMEKVDLVIVGAEGVVESGGVINKIGTNQMALCAKAQNKPFYVVAESFKFVRLFPLNQQDVPDKFKYKADTQQQNKDLLEEHPWIDYTSPSLITLLFTDLGVLTPSAISDELIKLYL